MKKRLITAALCFILLVSFSFSAFAAPTVLRKNVTSVAVKDATAVTLDGEKVRFEAEPVKISSSIDSDIYVPMLSFCEIMGAKVLKWDEESQSALAVFREFAIDASAGDVYITANGRCLYAEYGCRVIDGVLMVQLSTLCKALDAVYEIDMEAKTIDIISGAGIIMSGDEFYDEEDLFWLARIIWAESGNQCFEGQIAVGNVVLNRVNNPNRFPNDVYGVIFQSGQFEPVMNGTVYNNPTEECWAAAKLALEGVRPVGDCLYFAAIYDCWAGNNRVLYRRIEGHYFWL
ncbi:MAG: cell wall hydrolase [Oscillospiraceae bacterium]|nr:cell wall hydrolase [Oscillospiraceae bacterium]